MREITWLVALAFGLPLASEASSSPDPLTRAEELIAAGEYGEARVVLEEAAAAVPHVGRPRYLLGKTLLLLGDMNGAQASLEKAVELDPRDVAFHLALADLFGRRTRTASFVAAPRWASRWRRELETAFQLDPAEMKVRDRLIQYLSNAPTIAGGDRTRAKHLAQEAVALDEIQGRLLLAGVLRRAGEQDEALAEYQRVLELEPGNARAHHDLGYLSLEKKEYRAAEESFLRYIASAPDAPDAHDSLADCYAAQGMTERAMAKYLQALEKDPRFSASRLKLARAYEKAQLKDEAVRHYRLLVELTPGDIRVEEARARLKAIAR